MLFEFSTASRIIFGSKTTDQVSSIAKAMGRRAIVVVGSRIERARRLLAQLEEEGLEVTTFQVLGEPTVELAREGVKLARALACQLVIGFGGGSVLDTGKVIAALLSNDGDLLDYLEIIGKGKELQKPSAFYIAIPTTAGTGAEVTRNAVLGATEHKIKVSMRSHFMLPHVAIVDPTLTYSLPQEVTASTGFDALTQLMEAFVSKHSNPLTDALCKEGLIRVGRSLEQAFLDGENPTAREDMALASLFGGLALANAKLGAVHGLAGPLGGMYPAPHGIICGKLLPFVMDFNVKALRERQPGSRALPKYDEIAQMLTGNPNSRSEDAVAWVKRLASLFDLPSLSMFGLKKEDFPAIVENAQRASSMRGNPIQLQADELTQILEMVI